MRAVSSLLKEKVQTGSKKIRNFENAQLKARQNNLFRNNRSQLYKELGKTNVQIIHEMPDPVEATKFWGDIWSNAKDHNRDASWLTEIRADLKEVREQGGMDIKKEDVRLAIRKMSNWKAPGPDGIRGFWFKKFDSLLPVITSSLKSCLDKGVVPTWMVKGRTVLIQKDAQRGNVASNYRPLTCLPLMWKLLTGMITEQMYAHLKDNGLLPEEQKGCRKSSRGTKDELVIDKAVLKEAKKMQRSLAMGWVDYRKAYDMVPHSWITEMMDTVRISPNVKRLINNSMKCWKTELSSNGKVLGQVDINRGIFQGDSLSPLLFVITMIPLSMLLRKEKLGYAFGEEGKLINHLLFMDDLKVFAKDEKQLDQLIELVFKFSKDVGMEFGMEKCAMMVIKRGVKIKSESITLPDGETMKEVDQEGYKYLGILEGVEIRQGEMKELIRKEYLRRVKVVASSWLYGGHVIG